MCFDFCIQANAIQVHWLVDYCIPYHNRIDLQLYSIILIALGDIGFSI